VIIVILTKLRSFYFHLASWRLKEFEFYDQFWDLFDSYRLTMMFSFCMKTNLLVTFILRIVLVCEKLLSPIFFILILSSANEQRTNHENKI
jgi:hypothetical protein